MNIFLFKNCSIIIKEMIYFCILFISNMLVLFNNLKRLGNYNVFLLIFNRKKIYIEIVNIVYV